jgi:hypothetical protein
MTTASGKSAAAARPELTEKVRLSAGARRQPERRRTGLAERWNGLAALFEKR